jgi:hypothetical protein
MVQFSFNFTFTRIFLPAYIVSGLALRKLQFPAVTPAVTFPTFKCDAYEEMGVKKFVWMQINLKRLAHFATASFRLLPFEFFPL